MKIFAALRRVASPPERPTPRARPFDDGLVELARLIAREVPAGDTEASSNANPTQGERRSYPGQFLKGPKTG